MAHAMLKLAIFQQAEAKKVRSKKAKIAAWKAEKSDVARTEAAQAVVDREAGRSERVKERARLDKAEKKQAIALYKLRQEQEEHRAREAKRVVENSSRGPVSNRVLIDLYQRDVARVRQQNEKRDKLEADR